MSKRLDRLTAWIEANPYRLYADYRDTITDEQAQMLLDGDFESFDESMCEWEFDCSRYIEWADWESDFAEQAGYDEWDDMPEWLQDYASESRFIDASDLIEGAIRNYSGNIAATLYKRNGEPIELLGAWGQPWDKVQADYLRRHCGIDPRKSEPTYAGTYLKAIGQIDLLAIYRSQRKPRQIHMSPRQTTIGHESLNGSGSCGDDQYKGKARWMDATFRVDSLDRWGIDAVFGLSGHMWGTEMETRP